MAVRDDLADYRSGKITLDELGRRWATAQWDQPATSTDPVEVWDRGIDDSLNPRPNTWDEIARLRNFGLLTPQEYESVCAAGEAQAKINAQAKGG